MINFALYNGDLLGLPTNRQHRVFRWLNPECKILFAMAKQGNAASCHFASNKAGIFKLRNAIPEFCKFVFDEFQWCRMILAKIKLKKIGRLIEHFGFDKIFEHDNIIIYQKIRG